MMANYREQPSVLPETLPAGVTSHDGSWVLTSGARLLRSGVYDADTATHKGVLNKDGGHFVARLIDWTTVPAPEPEVESDEQCVCGKLGCVVYHAPDEELTRFANEGQPAAEPHHCGECGAVTTAFLCEGCDARRSAASAPVVRGPLGSCGRGCPCVYCLHSTDDGQQSHERSDELTRKAMDSSANEREEAARQRIAVLEARERRLNPVTATQRELAKGHPWSNAEDFEP